MKLKWKKTGEILEVPEGAYRANPQEYESLDDSTQGATTDTTTQGGIDKNLYQQAWQMVKDTKNKNTIADTYKSATGEDLFGQPIEEKKTKIAMNKAENIVNFVDEQTKNLTYGEGIKKLPKAFGASLPLIGQYIDPEAQSWEEGRLGVAIQIATQVLGAEKRVSDKEAAAYLANIPSIWDNEAKRKSKLNKLKIRINADRKAQGLGPMSETSQTNKPSLEDIFQ